MPQKKLMMIHSTFDTPPISLRFTMSITHRTKATGWRKIASSTSTMNLIMRSVFHDRAERARDARPAAGGGVCAIRSLFVRRPDPASSDLPDRLEKSVHFFLGVVGRKARPHRSRQGLAATGGHLALDGHDLVVAHVQQVKHIWVRAEAAMPHCDAPLMAECRGDKAVAEAVDDKARKSKTRTRAPRFDAAQHGDTRYRGELAVQPAAQPHLVVEHVVEAELQQRLDRGAHRDRADHVGRAVLLAVEQIGP